MATRAARPVTVTLGEVGELADRRLRSGRYASMSEVVRAGLRALDREETALDALIKAKVEEAMADPRPTVSLEEGFAEVRRRIAARWGAHGS